MNAQLEPIEAALTRGRRRVPGPGRPLLRPAGGQGGDREPARGRRSTRPGSRCSAPSERRWADEVGFEEDGAARRGARRPGSGSRRSRRCSAIVTSVVRAGAPGATAADRARRRWPAARPTSGTARGDGVNLADVPPGEGPRVGRGLPADARGGLAADPPGARRRRGARRGAAPALRRDHPRARAPRAVVGGAARDARPRVPPAAQPVPPGRRAGLRAVRDLGGPPVPRVRPPTARRRRRPGLRRPPRVARRASPATRACPRT